MLDNCIIYWIILLVLINHDWNIPAVWNIPPAIQMQ
jgi:hypothetical protein